MVIIWSIEQKLVTKAKNNFAFPLPTDDVQHLLSKKYHYINDKMHHRPQPLFSSNRRVLRNQLFRKMVFNNSPAPLPVSGYECTARGWDEVDIILITGDAYIDHPSFGVALIGRLLESSGYRVAILSQPRYGNPDDFRQFGRPRLFFGITAGNLDSIVANYSGNGKVRNTDAYSPHGNPWFGDHHTKTNRRRPDRATLIYANLAKAAFKNVPIILGGIESSLRRFIHYDFKQEKLRGSILTDAKADLLIYGMAEKSILEAVRRISDGCELYPLPGSCRKLTDSEMDLQFPAMTNPEDGRRLVILPSWSDIGKDGRLFIDAERLIDSHARKSSGEILAQRQQNSWVIQYPASLPLSTAELDSLYDLPFSRKPHPSTPDIPAYRMIRDSITIVRGCSGNCSFCAISRHQGTIVSSRSKDSIINEAKIIRDMDDFGGTISDLGGPTANLYGSSCSATSCKRHDCLFPKVCRHLRLDENAFLEVLQEVSALSGVKHVFVSSGLRMELLLKTPRLLEVLLLSHLPGSIKIAPEHTVNTVLSLMHKEPHERLVEFVDYCRNVAKRHGRDIRFNLYIISAHPGCSVQDMKRMCDDLDRLDLTVRQFQDFTPTPGTLSTAMYVTCRDSESGSRIYVAKHQSDKRRQRMIVENHLSHHAAKKKRNRQR